MNKNLNRLLKNHYKIEINKKVRIVIKVRKIKIKNIKIWNYKISSIHKSNKDPKHRYQQIFTKFRTKKISSLQKIMILDK